MAMFGTVMSSGVTMGISGSAVLPFPGYTTVEAFLSHCEPRKDKVLVLYNKLENDTRSVLPLYRILDLIYRYSCISPFTTATKKKPLLLFEFNDEEFVLKFEDPLTAKEKEESLHLSNSELKYYHAQKILDINYDYIYHV